MKLGFRLGVFTLAAVLASASLATANSATNLLNKPCPKVKSTKVNNGIKLTCKSVAGKKVWVSASTSNLKAPLSAPLFTLVYALKGTNEKTPAVLIGIYGVSDETIQIEQITGFNVSARTDSNWTSPYFVPIESSDLVVQGKKVWRTYYSVGENSLGKNVAVRIQSVSKTKISNWSDAKTISTQIESINPTPYPSTSASPSPSPTVAPTPSPVTSALPVPEVGCSVSYLSALPYASQRIAILSMSWEKDSAGYVFANATMRNDNTMALRLVEFSFYVLHKGSLIYTTSTLEGNHHFFIQDDAKFNSIDKTSGAWLPGQVRTFKMPTNQMLECKSISVLSSGFTVKQGIGAN